MPLQIEFLLLNVLFPGSAQLTLIGVTAVDLATASLPFIIAGSTTSTPAAKSSAVTFKESHFEVILFGSSLVEMIDF